MWSLQKSLFSLLLWQHPLVPTVKQIVLVVLLCFLDALDPDSMDGPGVGHLLDHLPVQPKERRSYWPSNIHFDQKR